MNSQRTSTFIIPPTKMVLAVNYMFSDTLMNFKLVVSHDFSLKLGSHKKDSQFGAFHVSPAGKNKENESENSC